MATHSSILAWEIPWTEEPGGLQFVGLQRVGHDLMTERNQICSIPTTQEAEARQKHRRLTSDITFSSQCISVPYCIRKYLAIKYHIKFH